MSSEKGRSWWKQDKYTKISRWKRIFGIPVWPKKKKTIQGTYWEFPKDTMDVLEFLSSNDVITGLDKDSRVLEPGCNLGRNLHAIWQTYRCTCQGFDISEAALKQARELWAEQAGAALKQADVTVEDNWTGFADDEFDLVLTRWHLIHVPAGEDKTKYIKHLLRIGKSVVLLEPARSDKSGVEFHHEGEYCLSWDDWASYGFKLVETPVEFEDHTKVWVNL